MRLGVLKLLFILLFMSPQAYAQVAPGATTPQVRSAVSLQCQAGSRAKGEVDRWSSLSTCPEGYQVTGLGRLDLTGDHNNPILHVNDFLCDDKGCKAWCIGSGCTVEARCCHVISSDLP